MLNLYSKGCEYALRALSTVNRDQCRDGFSVRAVCESAGLPESFTRKVFQALVKHRILVAKRGPGGGYRFRKDPADISVLNIIHAIDGKDAFDKCVTQDHECDRTDYCSLHQMWTKTKSTLIKQFQESTVAQLIAADHR